FRSARAREPVMAAAWRLLPTDQAGTTTSAVSEDAPTTATVPGHLAWPAPGVLHSGAAAGPGPLARPTSPSRAPWQVPRRQSTARGDPAHQAPQSRTCGASPDQPGVPCNPEPQQRSTHRGSLHEPVTPGLPGAGGDRARSGDRGEGGLGVDPAAVGPRDQHDRGVDRADACFLEQMRCLAGLDQSGELAAVVLELLIAGADAAGQPNRLTARGGRGELFSPGSPGRDRGDLLLRQRSAGIDPEVHGPHERGQGVDGPGAFDVELLAGDHQDTHRRPDPLVPTRPAQQCGLDTETD